MFLTGEFSRIARVSKRMLQYYDEIGLLRPFHTDSQTGYRYYSAQQLPRLNRILALKDLGLTLDQIQRMIAGNIQDSEIQGMLLMQKAELEKQLHENLARFKRIEARINQRQQAQTLPDVVVKQVPATPILSTTHLCLNSEDGFRFVGYLMNKLPPLVGRRQLGHFIARLHAGDFSLENVDLEFGFILKGDINQPVALDDEVLMTVKTLPAVDTMATLAYVGNPQDLHIAFSALGEWMELHDYHIAAEPREIYIEPPRPGHEDEAVVEIQVPVEHRLSTNFFQGLTLNSG